MPPWPGRVRSARTGKPWAGGGTRAAARRKNLLTTGVFKKAPGPKARGDHAPQLAPEKKERCLLRQTANYQLSQWDAEDRILREDFNDDNQKIDETMAALKAGNYFEKLADVTTTQSCQQLDVDLSGVDFTQYDRLIIHPMIKTDTVHSAILRLNGRSDTIYSRGDHFATFCTSYNSGIGGGEVEITLDTFLLGRNLYAEPGDPRPTVNELFLAVTPGSVTPTNLKQLNFCCASSRPILPGTQVRVYGVRAC